MSKYSTNLLEIIDFYRFGCSSILNEPSEIEMAVVVKKKKSKACVYSIAALHKKSLASYVWDMCHILRLYVSILVIGSLLEKRKLWLLMQP